MCIMHTLQEVWAHDDNGVCGMLTNTVFPPHLFLLPPQPCKEGGGGICEADCAAHAAVTIHTLDASTQGGVSMSLR